MLGSILGPPISGDYHFSHFSITRSDPTSAVDSWGFPKIRDTILGAPVIRTIVFWGLYGGPLILGNY